MMIIYFIWSFDYNFCIYHNTTTRIKFKVFDSLQNWIRCKYFVFYSIIFSFEPLQIHNTHSWKENILIWNQIIHCLHLLYFTLVFSDYTFLILLGCLLDSNRKWSMAWIKELKQFVYVNCWRSSHAHFVPNTHVIVSLLIDPFYVFLHIFSQFFFLFAKIEIHTIVIVFEYFGYLKYSVFTVGFWWFFFNYFWTRKYWLYSLQYIYKRIMKIQLKRIDFQNWKFIFLNCSFFSFGCRYCIQFDWIFFLFCSFLGFLTLPIFV